jgi:radical SAM protein with 4Fe4S-binding SPASM domain
LVSIRKQSVLKVKDVLDRLQSVHPFPLSGTLTVTDRCNLSCPHCCFPKENRQIDRELTTKEIFHLLEQLSHCGLLQLTITGGEPFVRPDIMDIIEKATRERFRITLKTNASLLDNKILSHLEKSTVAELHVSVYSDNPDEHDSFVGMNGAFERAKNALKSFRKIGRVVHANTIGMNWNSSRLTPLCDWYIQEEWPYTFDLRLVHQMDGNAEPIKFQLSEEDARRVTVDGRILKTDYFENESRIKGKNGICGIGVSTVAIAPNGDVWPCGRFSQSIGNIRAASFESIWRKSSLLEKLRSLKWEDDESCRNCKIISSCHRCPAAAMLEHGKYAKHGKGDCLIARIRAYSDPNRGFPEEDEITSEPY